LEFKPKQYSYYDFAPIITVSIFASRSGGDFETWRRSFLIGAGLAVLQLIFYRLKKREIDPFALGLNLFLIVGSIGFSFEIPAVLSMFDQMREAASFVFVAIVGVVLVLLKEEGLLEKPGPKSKVYSGLLLFLICVCVGVSYQFKGDQLFSITLPFMGLFFVRSYLNKEITSPGAVD